MLAALLVTVAACGDQTDDATLETPDTTMVGDLDMRQPGEADTIDVRLSEYSIDMPPSIAAGNRVFRVVNDGTEEHNFEIEGMGVEEALPSNLGSGEEGTVQVQLDPGTYEIYCPVGDHAEQGMRMTLDVTEDHGGTVGDTEAGGASPPPQNPGLTQ